VLPSGAFLLALWTTAVAAEPVERITKSYFPKFFLTYTPDGSRFVYSRHHDNRRAANKILMGLRTVQSDGAGDRPLMPQYDAQVQIQEHATLSPDGKRLYFSGGGNDTGNSTKDVFVCDLDADFHGTNLRKIIPEPGAQIGEQPALSPDGTELVATDTSHNLWIVGSDGKGKQKLIQSAGNYCFQPAWSPDGEWIAFASDRDGDIEIYKVRQTGTELTRLTSSPSVDCRPKWSPDARWLAFVSNRDGNEDIFVMRADGTDVRNLTANSAVDDHPAWSPDGKHLAFVSMRDGGFDLYRLTVPAELQVGSKPVMPAPRPTSVGDLVAHYDFDHDAGTLVQDQAGRNTMQLFDAQLIQKDGRGCVRFNGTSSYASCGNGRNLQLAGPLTASLWIKLDSARENGYVLSKQGINIYVGSDGLPRFESRSAADNAWITLAAQDKIDPGIWTHVAAVFSPEAKAMLIFVNGKLSAQQERTDGKLGAVDSFPLNFGHYVASNSQWLKGDLDEIRLYRRALTADEIARLSDEQRPKVGVIE
jgi:TolB protein